VPTSRVSRWRKGREWRRVSELILESPPCTHHAHYTTPHLTHPPTHAPHHTTPHHTTPHHTTPQPQTQPHQHHELCTLWAVCSFDHAPNAVVSQSPHTSHFACMHHTLFVPPQSHSHHCKRRHVFRVGGDDRPGCHGLRRFPIIVCARRCIVSL
jgi:hypothetical protein